MTWENPAFLWMLEFMAAKARDMGRDNDVCICGEIASRKQYVPLLLRLGYRCFSVVPVMADDIRDAVAQTDLTTKS